MAAAGRVIPACSGLRRTAPPGRAPGNLSPALLVHIEVQMKPQSIYRERAEQCRLLAEGMRDPVAKASMLESAAGWKALAELVEQYGPPADRSDSDGEASQ